MYNRYIPQPDGSYRRSRVADSVAPRQQPVQRPQQTFVQREKEVQKDDIPDVIPEIREHAEPRHNPLPPSKQEKSITGFLRQLLPKGLDTGDLLIILLLLLMAGDNTEDQNTAMLTLAFYLFM